MLPVIDAANLNMANYAEMLGLGKRYTPDDLKKLLKSP